MRFIGHGAVHNAGLGNQLQALISAMMLGILTNRALLLDWPKVDAHGIVYAGDRQLHKPTLMWRNVQEIMQQSKQGCRQQRSC